jgi:hypothetical protein
MQKEDVLDVVKVVAANVAAASLVNIQTTLSIIALIVTIGYTLHKWIDAVRRGRFKDTVRGE